MLPHIVKGPLFPPLAEGVSHGDDDMMDLSRPLSLFPLLKISLSPTKSKHKQRGVGRRRARRSPDRGSRISRWDIVALASHWHDDDGNGLYTVKGPFSGEGSISKSCVCTRPRECPSAAPPICAGEAAFVICPERGSSYFCGEIRRGKGRQRGDGRERGL